MAKSLCAYKWGLCYTFLGMSHPHVCLEIVDKKEPGKHQVHRCDECKLSEKVTK